MTSGRLSFAGALLIVVFTLIAYMPVMRCGFIWDDNAYVTNNKAVIDPNGLSRIWLDLRSTPQYYPLTFTSFYLEHRLWGLEPLGYHAVNVLLHAANAVMLWFVLRRLGVPGSWLAAALFAVHPIEVESVAWIPEQEHPVCLFCYRCPGSLPTISPAAREQLDRLPTIPALGLVRALGRLVCSGALEQERHSHACRRCPLAVVGNARHPGSH